MSFVNAIMACMEKDGNVDLNEMFTVVPVVELALYIVSAWGTPYMREAPPSQLVNG